MTTTTRGVGPKHEPEPRPARTWLTYTAAALLFLFLGVTMFGLYSNYQNRQDQAEAEEKAAELHSRLVEIGITAFDQETIQHVLGSDGGAFCTDPAALVEATANLAAANGAAGPGIRPSVLDERRIEGDRLVIEVYCPDQLGAFEDYVASLNLDSTTTQPGSTEES